MTITAFSILSGCWKTTLSAPEHPPSPAIPQDQLPNTLPELMALAEAKMENIISVPDLSIALVALDQAKTLLPANNPTTDPVDIYIQEAIVCYLISERMSDKDTKVNWILRGEEAASEVIARRPDRVEGYYYLAVLKGRHAENGGLKGFGQVRSIEELGLKAAEIDPTFEDGGPYRLLAMLYSKAPPWPASIGDMDLALEYAEKALSVSRYTMNHLIMAEVLIEDEEFAEARKELRWVLAAPKTGKWAKEGEFWRHRARQLLDQIK